MKLIEKLDYLKQLISLHYYFTIKEGFWVLGCWGYEYEHKQSTYEYYERGDHRRVSSSGIAPRPN